MLVKELIETLSQLPPEALVQVRVKNTYYDCLVVVPNIEPDEAGNSPEVYIHAHWGLAPEPGCTGRESFETDVY